MHSLASFYDEEYYDGGKGYHSYNDDGRFQNWADDIVARFSPKSVLDFGCAKGYLVKALRDRGVEAYGYDVSEYAVSKAPKEVKKYVSNSVMPKVDLVVSYDTFEHIPEAELDFIFESLESIGKRFYFVVGTLNTPNWEHDESRITMHHLDWWEELFPKAEWGESK